MTCRYCNSPFWLGTWHHEAHDADTRAEHHAIRRKAEMHRRHYGLMAELDHGQRLAALRRHAAREGRVFR